MAFLGTLLNVATVGVGLLNSFVNKKANATEDNDYVCQLDSGERVRILSHYILVDLNNPHKVGKSFPGAGTLFRPAVTVGPTSPSLGPNSQKVPIPDPTPTNGVALTVAQNDQGVNSVYAVNTTTDTDFQLSYANTDGEGNTTAPAPDVLARATNKYKPNLVDVTDRFADFQEGNIVISNAQVAAPASVTRALQRLAAQGQTPKTTLPVSNLIGNYGISNIVASSIINWPISDKSGSVTWAWTSDATTGDMNGITITNTAPYQITIQATLTWNNPTEAYSLDFTANASTTNGGVTTQSFPANNRPLANASVALVRLASSEEYMNYIKGSVAIQVAQGRTKTIKYTFI